MSFYADNTRPGTVMTTLYYQLVRLASFSIFFRPRVLFSRPLISRALIYRLVKAIGAARAICVWARLWASSRSPISWRKTQVSSRNVAGSSLERTSNVPFRMWSCAPVKHSTCRLGARTRCCRLACLVHLRRNFGGRTRGAEMWARGASRGHQAIRERRVARRALLCILDN